MAESGITTTKDTLTPWLELVSRSLTDAEMIKMLKKIQIQAIRDNIKLFTQEKYADEQGNEKKWVTWNKGKGHIKPGTTKYSDGTWKLTHSAMVKAKSDTSAGLFRKGESYYIKGAHKKKLNLKTISGKRYSLRSKLNMDTGTLRNSIGSAKGSVGINKVNANMAEYGTKVSYAEAQNEIRELLGISKKTFDKIFDIIFKHLGIITT